MTKKTRGDDDYWPDEVGCIGMGCVSQMTGPIKRPKKIGPIGFVHFKEKKTRKASARRKK